MESYSTLLNYKASFLSASESSILDIVLTYIVLCQFDLDALRVLSIGSCPVGPANKHTELESTWTPF